MRGVAVLAGLVLCSTLVSADERHVDFDLHFDFSKVKTFTIREGRIDSARSELNNAIVQTKVTDAIRAALASRGLKETSSRPDVVVEFRVSHVDYSVGPFGVARPISPGRGGRGRGRESDPQSTDPVGFVEGMLVIDLNAGDSGTLVWRGVFRDTEKTTFALSGKLPGDAKKLLSEYPPKRKT